MQSDRFYDIIAGQAQTDPEFKDILDMTEGSLQYNGAEEGGEEMIGSLTLLADGNMVLGIRDNPQAFLQALEHAHHIVSEQIMGEDEDD